MTGPDCAVVYKSINFRNTHRASLSLNGQISIPVSVNKHTWFQVQERHIDLVYMFHTLQDILFLYSLRHFFVDPMRISWGNPSKCIVEFLSNSR